VVTCGMDTHVSGLRATRRRRRLVAAVQLLRGAAGLADGIPLSRADGRGNNAGSLAVVPHVGIVASWPPASPVCKSSAPPHNKNDAGSHAREEGARGTWSSANSSGEHRHLAGMEHGEQGVASAGPISLRRVKSGEKGRNY
jgi:hypothetical protein